MVVDPRHHQVFTKVTPLRLRKSRIRKSPGLSRV